jgi:hypothetical protein
MMLADVAFSGLVAVCFATGGPEDARSEDGDEGGDDEERGSDVHA